MMASATLPISIFARRYDQAHNTLNEHSSWTPASSLRAADALCRHTEGVPGASDSRVAGGRLHTTTDVAWVAGYAYAKAAGDTKPRRCGGADGALHPPLVMSIEIERCVWPRRTE